MRIDNALTVSTAVILVLTACSAPSQEAGSASDPGGVVADAVYSNGRIYTVDDDQPWAEAVAIKDGQFMVVGSNAEVATVTGSATEVVDLGGRMVLPGLIDVHCHPMTVAVDWANLRIENATDAEAILGELREYAAAHPELPVIRGSQWNLGVFPGDSPRKELLDEIVSDRPVYLQSQTGHSAWVNTKALEMAGITKDTPNGGKFVFDVDPETGEPSGTVREFAMGAVENALPRTKPERISKPLADVFQQFNAYGHTSLKAAEGEPHYVGAASILESQGNLNLRLFPAWHWRTHYSSGSPDEEDQAIANWKEFESALIYPRYVKIFYDGGPDSYTALMLEDYEGRPGFKGKSHLPKKEVLETISRMNADGLGVLVHVLGDGGAREVVDIFVEVRRRNGDNEVPLHLSHAWTIRPEDITRLAEVDDACIDFSPALGYPAVEISGSMVPPLGEQRYQQFFPVRAAFETDISVGFGSDWAASLIPDPNAFHYMQTWVTRADPEAPSAGTVNADQAITLEQAIRGYTLGGAECLGFDWDDKIGSIEEGKLADFIVLDRNVFETPITELHKTRVKQTILGGKVVWAAE